MKNKQMNLQDALGSILRQNPKALQRYVEELYRDVLNQEFYALLMEKQNKLNVCIPPNIVIRAMQRVLSEEMKNGALKPKTEQVEQTQVILQVQKRTLIIKKIEEKTR